LSSPSRKNHRVSALDGARRRNRPSVRRTAATLSIRAVPVSSNADTAPAEQTGKWRRKPLPRFHGRYLLEERLGVGGMGVVYSGSRVGGTAKVAVKVLSEHLRGPEGAERFRREIAALCQLRHPNIVRLIDHGWVGTQPFYVMELVEGPDLTGLIGLEGPQPMGRVCAILRQLAGALAHAHGRGIVHRDVKPSNIILGWDDERGEVAKLLDFGLVLRPFGIGERLTAEDMLLGTPGYIAPEGARNSRELSARSDIYALAMIAFHLRTGKHLFRPVDAVCDESHRAALERGWRTLREVGGLPKILEHAMWRSLRFDPSRREHSAEDLVQLLDVVLRELPASARWSRTGAEAWWTAHRADEASRAQAASISPQLSAK